MQFQHPKQVMLQSTQLGQWKERKDRNDICKHSLLPCTVLASIATEVRNLWYVQIQRHSCKVYMSIKYHMNWTIGLYFTLLYFTLLFSIYPYVHIYIFGFILRSMHNSKVIAMIWQWYIVMWFKSHLLSKNWSKRYTGSISMDNFTFFFIRGCCLLRK